MAWLGALQPLVLGVVLLWSGAVKALGRAAPAAARRTALAKLVGEARAPRVYRLVGAAELLLALALLAPPALPAEAVAATVLAAGFLGYLAYARVAAPDASCGCMSTRRTPVTWRSFGRAALLLLLAALAIPATTTWTAALAADPPGGLAVLAAGGAAVVALSPEADHRWLLPLRRLWVRLRHPLGSVEGHPAGVPLEASLQRLHESDAYRSVGALLRSGLRETWDEDGVRILCFTAEYDGRAATAVFAVPLHPPHPDATPAGAVAGAGNGSNGSHGSAGSGETGGHDGHDVHDGIKMALVDEESRATLLVSGAGATAGRNGTGGADAAG
jgi:hypothetical protein